MEEWGVQVTDYQVCMTRRCWWRGSARCAVEGWPGDCGGGVEKYLLLIGLKKQVRRASRAVALWLM